jgi:hypothetical protein
MRKVGSKVVIVIGLRDLISTLERRIYFPIAKGGNMKRFLMILLVLSAFTVPLIGLKRSSSKAFEEKIVALEKQANEVIKKIANSHSDIDRNTLLSLLADEFVYVDPRGIAGKSDFISSKVEKGQKLGVEAKNATFTDFRMEDVKVIELNKDAGLITYKITAKVTRNGKDLTDQDYASSVWVNRGGKWLNLFGQSTPVKLDYAFGRIGADHLID